MALALVIYLAGRRLYVKAPPAGRRSQFLRRRGAVDALSEKARKRVARNTAPNRSPACAPFSGIALVFAPTIVFWALYWQYGSTWFNQAEQMNRDVFGWHMESAQMEALNAILILMMVPAFAYAVYPALERAGLRPYPSPAHDRGHVHRHPGLPVGCDESALDRAGRAPAHRMAGESSTSSSPSPKPS